MTIQTVPATSSSVSAVLTAGHVGADQVAYSAPWPDHTVLLSLLPREVWEALGRPTQITVTITPGDTLTDEVAS